MQNIGRVFEEVKVQAQDLVEKVKELIQKGRIGIDLFPNERKTWPVAVHEGRIVWVRGWEARWGCEPASRLIIEVEVQGNEEGRGSEIG